jgi:type IV fimbrial biogenesis protein FimT
MSNCINIPSASELHPQRATPVARDQWQLHPFHCERGAQAHWPGFTLIELVVTVAMMGILLGVSIPSFQTYIQSSRATVVADSFVNAVQVSRSEAAKRMARVQLCRRNSSATGCEDGTDWSNGWLICVAPCNSADLVIRVWEAPVAVTTLTATSASGVAFLGNGQTSTSIGFYVAFGGTEQQRCVTVSQSGRILTKKEGCT